MTAKTQSANEERKGSVSENGNRAKDQANQNGLYGLLEKGLKDIYSAEKQLVESLPEIAQAADNEELEDAITAHVEQTKKHVARLEKILERKNISKTDMEKCVAMEGLIQEGKKIVQEFSRGPVRDSALIIGAQKIEHYEIASYGSLCELADVLGEDKILDILGRTLDEEEETDELLSHIAQQVNDEACEITLQENY
jgi:ferritin-like metal-binding protein YciE